MSREIYDRFTDGDKPERPLSPLLPTDGYESKGRRLPTDKEWAEAHHESWPAESGLDKQERQAEDLAAYEAYAAEEARGYEQIFWEQVFLAALADPEMNGMMWDNSIEIAADTADRACAERAKRLK